VIGESTGKLSKSDRPTNPSYDGGADEGPKPQNSGKEIKEPPEEGSEQGDEKFPRKCDLPQGSS
jgi:hypothetical protein